MLFVEPRFLVFLAVVFGVTWSLRSNRSRKLWLLGCSYCFYAAWDPRFLSLIVASTVVDYAVGRALPGARTPRRRRAWLLFSLMVNLGLLGVFKYLDFFIDSAVVFTSALGLPLSASSLRLILPVGISFYTFQTLSYTIDVYRRQLEPSRSLLDVALFVGFFPQLVAGPIVRARSFLPQLESPRRLGHVAVRSALVLFLLGFFKKACVADNVGPVVDLYFADPASYDALSAWIAAALFAVQIYGDFSGYSDMAIASAALLGFNLAPNFRAPYLAANVGEFWRRWHMSLSSWLRDYLYIPLGGNRGGRFATHRNLMLTMLLGGLWHGAAWNFVAWGGLHGLALVAHRIYTERRASRRQGAPPHALLRGLAVVATFVWVCLAWIFFRAPDDTTALTVAKAFVLLRSDGPLTLGLGYAVLFAVLAAGHILVSRRPLGDWWERLSVESFAAVYGAATAVCIAFLHREPTAFIYFQF